MQIYEWAQNLPSGSAPANPLHRASQLETDDAGDDETKADQALLCGRFAEEKHGKDRCADRPNPHPDS